MPSTNVTNVDVFCRSRTEYLQGVWFRRDGANLSLFRYRQSFGTAPSYLMARTAGALPVTAERGFETGVFFLDDQTGDVFDVSPDDDELVDGLAAEATSGGRVLTNVSFRDGSLILATAPESDLANVREESWTRLEADPQGPAGAWTGMEGSDSSFVIAFFEDTQQYMVVEPVIAASNQPCDQPGVEFGAYAYNPQSRTITISGNLVDTNGCAGGHDPSTQTYQTLQDIYFVDLDADAAVLDGLRLHPSGGSPDLLLREGYRPQDFASITSTLKGTWTSFLSRTPSVVYGSGAREVYRFDAAASSFPFRISYMNGYVDSSHSGIEAGRVEYSETSGALTVYTGLDTNGVFGGLNDAANVDANGNPLQGSSPPGRVFVYLEYINDIPTILHAYDYINNDSRQYIRGPQRQSAELVGTWVDGNVSFFSPTVMFFEDNSFFLLDPEGTATASCTQLLTPPTPGIEFGTWSYSQPTLSVSLGSPAAVADTNGCGGLWNPDAQASNVQNDNVFVSDGGTPADFSDDLLGIGNDVLLRVPNTSTIPLQSSYVVRGFSALNGVNATATLRDGNGNIVQTLSITGQSAFAFTENLPDNSVWEVSVSTSDQGKRCDVTPSTGVISGGDSVVEVTCGDQVFALGGLISGLRVTDMLTLSVQRSPMPFQVPPQLTLDGTGFNQSFTFPNAAFVPGDGYVVQVVTAPVNRFCRVSNGTGTFSSSNINNINIECLDNQIQIGAIVPTTPVIGREVSISGFGFTTSSRFFVGSVEIDSGTTGFQATARELRFIMPNVGAGSHTFRASAFSGASEIGRDSREINVAQAFTVDSLQRFSRLAIGGMHTCAIAPPSSEVSCWGRNLFGEAGINPDPGSGGKSRLPVPQRIGLTGVEDIVAGAFHTCARTSDLRVSCWGANGSGQLGNGTTVDNFQPQVVKLANGDPLTNVQQISAGGNTSCAKVAGGNVFCWGSNASGVIDGQIPQTTINHAVLAYSQNNAVVVAVGFNHTCVLRSGNEVACWGSGPNGQLGAPAVGSSAAAGTILPSDPVVTPGASAVAVSDVNTCIITSGTLQGVKCWGSNGNGQLLVASTGGGNPLQQSEAPIAIGGLDSRVSKLSVAANFICATQSVDPVPPETNPTTVVRCWGGNERGQLGNGRYGQPFLRYKPLGDPDSSVPETVLDITNASEIYAGGLFDGSEPGLRACAVTGQGRIRCWGSEYEGVRGDGDTNTGFYRDAVTLPLSLVQTVPTGGRSDVGTLLPAAEGGSAVTCARDNAGEVRCAGGRNQIGGDANEGSSVFSLVTGIPPSIDIAVGDAHVCSASSSAGNIVCWGDGVTFDAFASQSVNLADKIGIGTIATPTNGLNKVLSAGKGHTCALAVSPDAGLYCWGSNDAGQAGISAGPSSLVPNKVTGLVTPGDFDAGGDFNCARDSGDGDKIKCWGRNDFSQLGLAGPDTSAPVTVRLDDTNVPLTGAQDVSAGFAHACARVSNNKVRCWGDNNWGQTGQPASPGVPVEGAREVPGIPDIVTVAAGDRTSCGITATQRRVVCWGYDPFTNQSDVVRFIPGISGAMSLSIGDTVGCARLNDSRAQCWGRNRMGEMGLPYKPNVVRLSFPGEL